MNIQRNKNFISVQQYQKLNIEDVLSTYYSLHLSKEREARISLAIDLNRLKDGTQAPIDAVFLVDKGHEDGKELHCITQKGIIFILNEQKYLYYGNGFITALIARPNQVKRLYNECGMWASKHILDICYQNECAGLNKI